MLANAARNLTRADPRLHLSKGRIEMKKLLAALVAFAFATAPAFAEEAKKDEPVKAEKKEKKAKKKKAEKKTEEKKAPEAK